MNGERIEGKHVSYRGQVVSVNGRSWRKRVHVVYGDDETVKAAWIFLKNGAIRIPVVRVGDGRWTITAVRQPVSQKEVAA
jgi:hypothetical protein